MDIATAHGKIESLKYEDEKKVGHLLVNLGLEYIDGNAEIKKPDGNNVGEIDLLFRFDKFLFIIQTTRQKESGSEKIDHFFSRWKDTDNLKLISSKYNLPPLLSTCVYFDLRHSAPLKISSSLDHHINDKEHNCKLLYADDVDYFERSFQMIGKWARNDLLGFLDVPRGTASDDTTAIQFYISGNPAFIFAKNVKALLESCYIYRRIKKETGYQRALNPNRMGAISRDIERGKILAFPNSVLINSDKKFTEHPLPPERCPAPINIVFPTGYCSCRVIDGQHRLLGFAKLNETIQEAHALPVVAFQNLSLQEEMKTFIDINSKQKKIDTNLILMLKSGFSWPENSNEFAEKIAVDVINKLNADGPLKGKIYLGIAYEKRGKKITLATLVSAITKNNLVGGDLHLFQSNANDLDTPYERVRDLFNYMRTHLSSYYEDTDPFFMQNKGLRIIFRFVQIFERNKQLEKISISLEDAIKDLSLVVTRTVRNKLDDYYGEGGANKAVQEIFKILKSKRRRHFKKFEPDLRKLQLPT